MPAKRVPAWLSVATGVSGKWSYTIAHVWDFQVRAEIRAFCRPITSTLFQCKTWTIPAYDLVSFGISP